MGSVLVSEVLASETSERSMSLECVPVKHRSNMQTSDAQNLFGGRQHQREAKLSKSSLPRGLESTFFKMVLQHRSRASLAITSATESRRSAAGAPDHLPVNEKVSTRAIDVAGMLASEAPEPRTDARTHGRTHGRQLGARPPSTTHAGKKYAVRGRPPSLRYTHLHYVYTMPPAKHMYT